MEEACALEAADQVSVMACRAVSLVTNDQSTSGRP